jgi:hypothetical protein
MDAIEVRVDNVNLIEIEFEPGQTDIEIAANFNPVIEVKDFDYPQELVYINQRISQILQTEGRLVEWNKSATHIQYRYAGDAEWIDLVALSEIKGDKGDPQTRAGLGLGMADVPEFSNTFNTALNTTAQTGGEIAPTLWAWIQSVYATIVPKSVKSHIIGLWTNQKSVSDRIVVLEEYPNDYEKKLALAGDYINNAYTTGALSTYTLTSNRIILFPFIPKLSFNCREAIFETASSVPGAYAKIMIFGSTNKRPFTKLFEGNSFDCSSVAENKVDTSINFNFIENTLYWIGLASSGAPLLRAQPSTSVHKIKHTGAANTSCSNCIYFVSSYSSIPANLNGISLIYSSIVSPLVHFKITSL